MSHGLIKRYFILGSVFLLVGLFSSSCWAEDWLYTLKKDDNLWNISEQYLDNLSHVKQLQTLNHIKDPWHIPPGTKITIPEKWLKKYPTLARVTHIQGQAQLIEKNIQGSKAVKVGTLVISEDEIITEADSTVIVQFLDGSQLALQEKSHLAINNLGVYESTPMTTTELNLKKGRLETKVAPKKGSASQFKIRTPLSTTSVRGTEYRMMVKKKQAIVEVLEGSVAVKGSQQKHLVKAGFGLVSSAQGKNKPIKLLEAPDTSTVPVVFEKNPLQFQLNRDTLAAAYRLQVSDNRHFQQMLFDKTLTSDILRGVNLADGDYYLRLRAIDAQGIEGHNNQLAIRVNVYPEAPFLLFPKPNGGVSEEQPDFEWAKRDEIQKYHFQLADNPEFNSPLVDIADYSGEKLTIEPTLALGHYFWRVAALDENNQDGPFSGASSFRRIMPAPLGSEPEITEEAITIQFQEGLAGQSYQFQLASDAEFTDILVDKYNDRPIFELEKLDSGSYFIRAKTIDADGFKGNFGNPQQIEVPMSRLYWFLLMLPLFALIAL